MVEPRRAVLTPLQTHGVSQRIAGVVASDRPLALGQNQIGGPAEIGDPVIVEDDEGQWRAARVSGIVVEVVLDPVGVDLARG